MLTFSANTWKEATMGGTNNNHYGVLLNPYSEHLEKQGL